MSTDPRKIIVVEGSCDGCGVHAIHVYHQDFPEMRIEQATVGLSRNWTASITRTSPRCGSRGSPPHRRPTNSPPG